MTIDETASLPGVTLLPQAQKCESHRWNHVTGKALRNPELLKKYECKNRARWQLDDSVRGGVYCWPHLHSLLTVREFSISGDAQCL